MKTNKPNNPEVAEDTIPSEFPISGVSEIHMTTVQENLVKAIEDRMEEMGLPRHHAFHHGLMTAWFVNDGMVMVARKGFRTTPLYHSDRKMSEVMTDFRSSALWKA